jgi:hypothetical protein
MDEAGHDGLSGMGTVEGLVEGLAGDCDRLMRLAKAVGCDMGVLLGLGV